MEYNLLLPIQGPHLTRHDKGLDHVGECHFIMKAHEVSRAEWMDVTLLLQVGLMENRPLLSNPYLFA